MSRCYYACIRIYNCASVYVLIDDYPRQVIGAIILSLQCTVANLNSSFTIENKRCYIYYTLAYQESHHRHSLDPSCSQGRVGSWLCDHHTDILRSRVSSCSRLCHWQHRFWLRLHDSDTWLWLCRYDSGCHNRHTGMLNMINRAYHLYCVHPIFAHLEKDTVPDYTRTDGPQKSASDATNKINDKRSSRSGCIKCTAVIRCFVAAARFRACRGGMDNQL